MIGNQLICIIQNKQKGGIYAKTNTGNFRKKF